jgi:hypothetical protein
MKSLHDKLKKAGFKPAEIGSMMKASEPRVRKVLSTPGVRDVIDRYTKGREAGLKDDVHMSDATVAKAVEEIKNLIGGGENGTSNKGKAVGGLRGGAGEGEAGGVGENAPKNKGEAGPAGKTGANPRGARGTEREEGELAPNIKARKIPVPKETSTEPWASGSSSQVATWQDSCRIVSRASSSEVFHLGSRTITNLSSVSFLIRETVRSNAAGAQTPSTSESGSGSAFEIGRCQASTIDACTALVWIIPPRNMIPMYTSMTSRGSPENKEILLLIRGCRPSRLSRHHLMLPC